MGVVITLIGLGVLSFAAICLRKEDEPIAWGGVWGFGTSCTPAGKVVWVVGVFIFATGLYTWAYAPSGPEPKVELKVAPRGFVRATIVDWEDNGIVQVEANGNIVRLHEVRTCGGHPAPNVNCKADDAARAFAKEKLPPGTEVWAKFSNENIRKDMQSPGFAPVKMGSIRALNGDYMWDVLKQE